MAKGYMMTVRVLIVDKKVNNTAEACDYVSETFRGIEGIADWQYDAGVQGGSKFAYPHEIDVSLPIVEGQLFEQNWQPYTTAEELRSEVESRFPGARFYR